MEKRPQRFKRRGVFRKRMIRRKCKFCVEPVDIDYKDVNLMRSFVSERGKLLAGRITGVCAKHQRRVTQAVKRARILALLPFSNI